MLLSVRDVTLRFGGIVALDGVSFDVEPGTITGLIGPNGAGKTTVFNVVTRLYRPTAGDVELDGDVAAPDARRIRIVERGIARTFQNLNLFRTMSVLENVLVGGHARGRGFDEREALETLDVVGLAGRAAAACGRAALRDPEARRDRARARRPRRSCCCSTSRRVASTTRRWRSSAASCSGSATSSGSRPPRRAPHGARDARLRPRQRAQLRSQDRRRARRPRCRPTPP